MSELHWTGAALLLALAVLGSGSAQPRRGAILSWAEFARQHGLDAEEQAPTDAPAGGSREQREPIHCRAVAALTDTRPRGAYPGTIGWRPPGVARDPLRTAGREGAVGCRH